MRYLPLLWANLRRKPARLVFTLLSVFVAFMLFGLMSATREAFAGGVELIGNDRLITTHRLSLIQQLPQAYGDRIQALDGVTLVAHATWMQGYYQEPRNFIAVFAVDENYMPMYEEITIPPAQREAWLRNRTGVIIGKTLVERFGWQVGDRIPLQSAIWQREGGGNTYEAVVEGVYDSTSRAFDTASAILHHAYLEEARAFGKGSVGWYVSRIGEPERAAPVSEAIDALFRNSPAETKTSTEKAFFSGFLSQIGNIGKVVLGIVAAVFFSMLLVTANAMAQSVRERTKELAVLKALGFPDTGVLGLVLAESVLITVLGGGAGLLVSWGLARGLAEGALAQWLPAFYLTGGQLALGFALTVVLGALAGLWPGVQALRLRVAGALRSA